MATAARPRGFLSAEISVASVKELWLCNAVSDDLQTVMVRCVGRAAGEEFYLWLRRRDVARLVFAGWAAVQIASVAEHVEASR